MYLVKLLVHQCNWESVLHWFVMPPIAHPHYLKVVFFVFTKITEGEKGLELGWMIPDSNIVLIIFSITSFWGVGYLYCFWLTVMPSPLSGILWYTPWLGDSPFGSRKISSYSHINLLRALVSSCWFQTLAANIVACRGAFVPSLWRTRLHIWTEVTSPLWLYLRHLFF